MALNQPQIAPDPAAAAGQPLPIGLDHAALEDDGPRAFGDRMGTPAPDERVLWKGRPALRLLARSAFHTYKAGGYMALLAAIALMTGNSTAAMVAAGLGVVLVGLLYLLAWASARSTLYILTDERLIMRIGIAIETRINIPLKQVTAAHLRLRGKSGHGDIAFTLSGERILGTLLLWPHVRPWHYALPQPMLRAVPDAARVAQMVAEVRARFGAIERPVTPIKDEAPTPAQAGSQSGARSGTLAPVLHRGDQGLTGAPA